MNENIEQLIEELDQLTAPEILEVIEKLEKLLNGK